MIESLRLLCLLSITENGDLSLYDSKDRIKLLLCINKLCDGVFSQDSCQKIIGH